VILIILMASMLSTHASAQSYPNKPIRIITAEAGSNADTLARVISQGISPPLGQQLVVENHPGSVVIAAGLVAKAPADGYTVLVYGPGVWTVALIQDVPYDPVKDFAPVSLVLSSMHVLSVHPSLPARSVKELVTLAKAKPGQLNNSSSGVGTAVYFAAELFKAMAKVQIVRVDYRGAGSALYALLAGEVDLMLPTTDAVAPHIRSGKLRALAVTGAQPSVLFPKLPTVGATVPGYESVSALGLLAPAATPAAIVGRLNAEVIRLFSRPEVADKYVSSGVGVVASSPDAYAARIKSDMALLGPLIKKESLHRN
jgi:tripartite-type tricarboxylate transporter receptor subunit TctC